MDELTVQTADDVGVLEHDLGDERAGLQEAPALELEQVALGADHRTGGEAVAESAAGGGRSRHGATLTARAGSSHINRHLLP